MDIPQDSPGESTVFWAVLQFCELHFIFAMEENNNPATDTETMNLFSLSLLEREPDQDPTLIARPLRRDDFAKGRRTPIACHHHPQDIAPFWDS